MTDTRELIIDVRADELHVGDVLEEGVEIEGLIKMRDGWVKVISNLSSSFEPPARLVRVMRADPNRLGLNGHDRSGTQIHANARTRDTTNPGMRWEMVGDLRIEPL